MLIVTAFHPAGILLAANAVTTVRTAQGATAWAVSLVSVPFVAVPAYLVFGRSKFEGAMQVYEQRRGEIDALIDQMRTNLQPWSDPDEASASAYRAVQKMSGMALTLGNRVELLANGEATFDSILAGIACAERYVLVQFYMFHDEGPGNVDHIMWVTLDEEGPQMGNIALKGIFDRKGLDPSLFGAYDRKGFEGGASEAKKDE